MWPTGCTWLFLCWLFNVLVSELFHKLQQGVLPWWPPFFVFVFRLDLHSLRWTLGKGKHGPGPQGSSSPEDQGMTVGHSHSNHHDYASKGAPQHVCFYRLDMGDQHKPQNCAPGLTGEDADWRSCHLLESHEPQQSPGGPTQSQHPTTKRKVPRGRLQNQASPPTAEGCPGQSSCGLLIMSTGLLRQKAPECLIKVEQGGVQSHTT